MSLSSSSAASEAAKRRLLEAAEIVMATARTLASYSRKIPPSIKVRSSSSRRVVIVAGGPSAPNAYPMETGAKHPIYGKGPDKYSNFRPFLAPAAELSADAAAEAYAKVIDDWCRQLGWK